MNWLGGMRRGRGKKGGESVCEALKSLDRKLKTMEKASQGVMEVEVKTIKSLKDL